MKIGIIGLGFVGGTLKEVFKDNHEIFIYDKYKEEFKEPEVLQNTEVIFVCVPTPMKDSGEIDSSIVYESIELLNSLVFEKKPLVVIRSTVIPGTVEELSKKFDFDFVSNPEFLREKTVLQDFLNSKRIVMGANKKESMELLEKLYREVIPNTTYLKFDSKTAEMIKYASNTILAGQITMANEIYNICHVLGINYEDVKTALLFDDRISKNINVPGPDGKFGFGGKCFPKDLNAIIQLSKEKGYDPKFFEEVWRSNLRFRKSKDWQKIVGATSKNNYSKRGI